LDVSLAPFGFAASGCQRTAWFIAASVNAVCISVKMYLNGNGGTLVLALKPFALFIDPCRDGLQLRFFFWQLHLKRANA